MLCPTGADRRRGCETGTPAIARATTGGTGSCRISFASRATKRCLRQRSVNAPAITTAKVAAVIKIAMPVG